MFEIQSEIDEGELLIISLLYASLFLIFKGLSRFDKIFNI